MFSNFLGKLDLAFSFGTAKGIPVIQGNINADKERESMLATRWPMSQEVLAK